MNRPIEVLYLMEVEEIMDIIDANEFTKIMIVRDLACMLALMLFTHPASILQPQCTQVDLCISSNHFQVAERALYLFNNQRFVALLGQIVNELPVFIGSIVQHCSWLEPSLPSCSILRYTGSAMPTKCSFRPTWILRLSQCTTCNQGSFLCFNSDTLCFILCHSLLLSGLSKDKTAPAGDMDHDRASCAFFTLIRHPFITVSSMANAPTGMFPAFLVFSSHRI